METEHAIVVAIVGLIGVAITAGVTLVGTLMGRRTREHISRELDTGNGHTAGQALARVEELGWRHENRLDKIEVELREARADIDAQRRLTEAHLEEVAPLTAFVKKLQPEEDA